MTLQDDAARPSSPGQFPRSFEPVRVGTMRLQHRLVVPPHSGGRGLLLGNDDEFELHCAYWVAKVEGGVEWVGGGPTFVRNPLVPGFEPTGVGANGPGFFRHPRFVERMGAYVDRLHGAGGYGSVQFVLQGGMPIAPSNTLSGYSDNRIPHALDVDEIAMLVREYGESAALTAEAGADAIELHANHDDVLQWFLSPLTNTRTDGYGGSFEGRRSFLREIVASIRSHVRRPITLGLRLCIDEMIDGGYGIDDCAAMVAAFTAEGMVDYFSLDVGNNWGRVSYIPPGLYAEGEWAPLAGRVKSETSLPVVYVGRVSTPDTAERILADGHADLVGMARAMIADPQFVAKMRAGKVLAIRPCVGLNECIDRRTVERIDFACASNPRAGNEHEHRLGRVAVPRSMLVVGGGPAGMEVAALSAERGHRVQLWERESSLGGQLAVAALAKVNHRYGAWIRWQYGRLEGLGVDVRLGREADADGIVSALSDVVVMATGASARRPAVPGVMLPFVHTSAEVLTGVATPGARVVLIAEDDRAAPLAVADHLAELGHRVTLVHRTNGPAPLVGKYTIGALLARLDERGVDIVPMATVVGIEPGRVLLAHAYSGRRWSIDRVDSVVLSCGAVPNDAVYHAVRQRHGAVHLLGDAYAPRRMAFATKQAYELAATFD